MTWKIEFDVDVEKDLRKLENTAQKRIINYLKEKSNHQATHGYLVNHCQVI